MASPMFSGSGLAKTSLFPFALLCLISVLQSFFLSRSKNSLTRFIALIFLWFLFQVCNNQIGYLKATLLGRIYFIFCVG